MTSRRPRFPRALALLSFAAACGARTVTEADRLPPGAVTYHLVSVNGNPPPFIAPSTGEIWRSGQWVLSPDGSFTASFDVAAGTIPRTRELVGHMHSVDARSVQIDYSDGTQTIGTVTSVGFRAPYDVLTLGLSR